MHLTVGNVNCYPDDRDDDYGDDFDISDDNQANYPVNLNDYSWDELVDYFSGMLPAKGTNVSDNDQSQTKLPMVLIKVILSVLIPLMFVQLCTT